MPNDQMSALKSYPTSCSNISGAIQNVDPTNVFRRLRRSPCSTNACGGRLEAGGEGSDSGEAEVGELDVAGGAEEDRTGFDVSAGESLREGEGGPVDETHGVKIGDGLKDLMEDVGGHGFVNATGILPSQNVLRVALCCHCSRMLANFSPRSMSSMTIHSFDSVWNEV